jgi:hypothetical protein
MNRAVAVLGTVLLVLGVIPSLADSKPKIPFHEFTALEVQNFDNPKYETKEPMPDGWLPIIREDIVQRVIELHKFHHVVDFHDTNVTDPPKERVLLLRGKVIEFTQGSQAARFIVGFGAGKGKIVTLCEFVDKDTGEVIWQRKADGRVIGVGQPTEGAIKGLSKEIAKHISENW